MKRGQKQTAFTIVELLIVIVIIAILAAITVVAYNGIQLRSRAAAVGVDLRAIDKGLRALAAEEGNNEWWPDNTLRLRVNQTAPTPLGGGANPPVVQLIEYTTLKQYLQRLSGVTGTEATWTYDNDVDTYNGCATTSGGVNVFVYDIDPLLAAAIDSHLDDGDINCGKVTSRVGASPPGSVELRYNLSRSQSI